jgi:hypothetical protein
MAVIQSTDLDFDQIKSRLKTYLQSQTEFSDYDFEGSALSNVLDVLAYNTHINGLIANMGINESYISSAQLRSSVISHAETLGYNIRSKTSAKAIVNLSLATSNTSVSSVTLPANSKFSGVVDDVSYTFQTLEAYTAQNDGSGNFSFKTSASSASLPIYEGTSKTKTFIVGDADEDQIFVIPDETMDTSTMSVLIYDTPTSSSFVTYTNISQSVRVNADSTLYIVRETPNGYYEVTFSDGNILGKRPSAGNLIRISYLSTKGSLANAASTFTPKTQVSVGGVATDITVTTVSNSAGGDDKESVESIKKNAPRAFATQQRLVTAEDYKAIILQRYSSVLEDCIAWGGNDNVPPIYGRVYVSLKFKTGVDADTIQVTKDSIRNTLSANLGIMSIDTYFTDPVSTYIELITTFNFDPDQSGSTSQTTENLVLDKISSYFTDNLNVFGAVFRRSNLIAEIDDLSPAILNSKMDVKVQQRITIPSTQLNKSFNYTTSFPVALANADDVNYIVTTSKFTFDGKTCFIRNKLSETKLQIINADTFIVEADNIGTYTPTTGKIQINGLNPSAVQGDYLRVSAVPANQSTVRPLRNFIISLDPNVTSSRAVIDYQTTEVSL